SRGASGGGDGRGVPAGVVVLAGNGAVVVVRDELAVLQQQAVRLDVGVDAEVDVAARDRDALVGAADADTCDPAVVEVLCVEALCHQALAGRRAGFGEMGRAAAAAREEGGGGGEGGCGEPHGVSTTLVASRASKRR